MDVNQINKLLKRKLHPSARYRPGQLTNWGMYAHAKAREEGNEARARQLEETLGAYEVDWEGAAARIRRVDPEGILSLITMKQMGYNRKSKEYRALSKLGAEYRKLSYEERQLQEVNQRFRERSRAIGASEIMRKR